MNDDINRIKTVLCEKKRTNKWLAQQLDVNPTTVSKWCTNTSQPDLYTLKAIASYWKLTSEGFLIQLDQSA